MNQIAPKHPGLAAFLEALTGAKTVFYAQWGEDGAAWGFTQKEGLPGIALSDGKGNQLVVNIENLRTLLKMLEEGST